MKIEDDRSAQIGVWRLDWRHTNMYLCLQKIQNAIGINCFRYFLSDYLTYLILFACVCNE